MNETAKSRDKIVYSDRDSLRAEQKEVIGELVHNFLEVAHWASNRQIQIGIRGYATKRYSTLERYLKRKTTLKQLRCAYYGKIKVYAKKHKTRNFDLTDAAKIYHGLCCTECLIRFMTAKAGEPIPERYFRGYGRVPEFGVRYENGKLLLLEFSTKHDVSYTGKIRGKLAGYDDCLPEIERDFNAKPFVVFVLDVDRDRVKRLVDQYRPSSDFFFTDFKTFSSVPMGENLIAPIYIWKDGKEYALTR